MAKSLNHNSNEADQLTRGNWGGKLEFILSCLSYAVGLGNLWRFPYQCYRNGGGAFLIPFTVMLVLVGLPTMFMELSFGQYASEGVVSIWAVCPLMQGIGWGMVIVSSFIMIYYNVVIAWTLFYLIVSFNREVPWKDCGHEWNTDACGVLTDELKNCTNQMGAWINDTCFTAFTYEGDFDSLYNQSLKLREARVSPSDEYFHKYVLNMSEGFHDMGTVRWQLALCLFGAWVLVFLCLIKGIRSQGKVAYFTGTFPYLVLTVLLIRGLTLPGSVNGILFYLKPEWSRLASAKVWGDAAVQIFFSLSPCWGGLITLASYNKFHNNCLRDTLVVGIGDCLTSFFAGFVIFSILGFMAFELDKEVKDVASDGAGLAFIIYPEVVSRLPISPLWAVMFFLMMVTLGLGTQFSTVCTVHTTILDVYPSVLRQGRRPMFVLMVICIFGFLLGLICTTRGGMFMLQLIDNYAATYSLLIIGLLETITLSYFYGVDHFMKDISTMLGRPQHCIWKIMWKYVTPLVLAAIMVFTWVDYQRSKYNDYIFPIWADILGWVIVMTSVSAVPIVAIIKILTTPSQGSLWLTVQYLLTPAPSWGSSMEHRSSLAKIHFETTVHLYPDTPGTPRNAKVAEIGDGDNAYKHHFVNHDIGKLPNEKPNHDSYDVSHV